MTSTDRLRDAESISSLKSLLAEEAIRKNQVENVRTVLVVLSGRSMVYDDASLRQKIQLTYGDAKVYFMTTDAFPLGEKLPKSAKIDLLIDFTGPGHKHKWLWSRLLRSRTRVCVGRPAGFFREFIYDRVYPETKQTDLPRDVIERERIVQREVLAMAGVPLSHQGAIGHDLGRVIAGRAAKTK